MRYVVNAIDGPAGGDAWQAAVTRAYFPLDTDYVDRRAFRGSLEVMSLGVVSLSKMRCDAVRYRRRTRHFLDEGDSSFLVTIPERGAVDFAQGARSVRCGPGAFLLERGDEPYEFRHDEPNALWVLKVPSASVRSRLSQADRLSAMNFDAAKGVGALFVDVVRAAAGRAGEIGAAARELTGRHLLELLCLSLAGDDRVLDSEVSPVRAGHLHRAERYVRDNLKDPSLAPQSVADACGISLRYLQSLFRDRSRSIKGFIRDSRLDRCREDLTAIADPRTVAEIAYRWGFADQSQFCRNYRARFRCSPTDTRRQAVREAAGARHGMH